MNGSAMLLVALLAALACVTQCNTRAGPSPMWNKLAKLPREARVTTIKTLIEQRGLLDDQLIAIINAVLAKPNADPLEVARVKLNISKDFAEIHGLLDTLTITGLSGMQINNIKINPIFLKMDFDFLIPTFHVVGNYDFDAVFAGLLPVYGKGPFTLDAGGAKIGGTIQMGTNLAGAVFIKNLTLKLGLQSFHVDFQYLLGSAELSDVVNEMINDLAMDFFTRFESSIETATANTIMNWFNTTFEGYTLSDIINLITGGGGSGVAVLPMAECKPFTRAECKP